jgi:hypothetical protein
MIMIVVAFLLFMGTVGVYFFRNSQKMYRKIDTSFREAE